MAKTLLIAVMIFCSKILIAQAQSPSPSLALLRSQKIDLKFGTSIPFTWNASIEYIVDKSGLRVGILSQGPHDPYNPEIVDAKPSITTYGVLFGWGIPAWLSKFKSTGAYAYLGTGTTKQYEIKFHYNCGYVAQVQYSIYQEPNYAVSVFCQYKKMLRVINKEDPGLTWETFQANLTFINVGLSGQF